MTRQEEIASLAGKAGELVENLKTLREQAGHYSAATAELSKARADLAHLIDETNTLVGQTHQIIGHLTAIGAGQIFERLGTIEARQKRQWILWLVGFLILLAVNVTLLVRMK